MLNGYTANDEWIRTLAAILKNKKNIAPRAKETYEILNHSTCVDMTQPIVTFAERWELICISLCLLKLHLY